MAKVSFGMFGAGISASTGFENDEQEEAYNEFNEKKEKEEEFYVGGGGAFIKDKVKWYAALTEDISNVAPLGFGTEIAPIFDLFTGKNFPEDPDIEAKADRMKELLTEAYCDWVNEQGVDKCDKTPFDPADQIKMDGLEGGPSNHGGVEVVIGTKVYRFGGVGSD